ncbi:xanthosine utilization system XapX-like protein [Microbacterium natoriense]|uniref:Xanthosine utilization system XapX-like protein n=1 Tax=Microbacterium natoriense TaxID=284570 RepID=A0AAW8EVI6_9MICO|nr:hypothetical protein [Microbacterium natoriense]MDQ0647298.1 xanthosine utilization system XapX-like protein [Microbacterium natoriense]
MTKKRNELAELGSYLMRISGTSLLLTVPVYLATLLVRAPLPEAIASVGVMGTMTGIILVAGVALFVVAQRTNGTAECEKRVTGVR